jgi:hypothetical protein
LIKQNICILELKVVRKPMRPEKEPTNLIEKAFSNLFSEEMIKN